MTAGSKAALLAGAALALGAAGVIILKPEALPRGLRPPGAVQASEPFACPMEEDAEVRSDKPGRCPKCGMNLVPLSQTKHKGKPPSKAPRPGRYYCPMHPTYISDRPGDCPICNMSLVPLKQEAAAGSGVPGYATATIQPQQRQLIGVKTAAVGKRALHRTIRAAGRVEYNEKSLAAVSLKVGGWIEELFVKSTGEAVRKGQPLFALYSPDLLEAQRNYLIARASRDEGILRAARDRLFLWDVSEEQIRAIEEKNEPFVRLPILSKVEGIVTRRNVVQGAYAEAGRDLLEIADLSTVWIHADVYEYEVPEVKVGQPASAHLSAFPGEAVQGKVVYIYPYLNEITRTVRVRLEVPNAEGKLKPGMYAEVAMPVDLGEPLAVPDEAVMDTGARRIAFVDLGEGRFEPREVDLGPRADGFVAVRKGLKEGEKVAVSGNFLIDSESRIKSALLGSNQEGGHEGHNR